MVNGTTAIYDAWVFATFGVNPADYNTPTAPLPANVNGGPPGGLTAIAALSGATANGGASALAPPAPGTPPAPGGPLPPPAATDGSVSIERHDHFRDWVNRNTQESDPAKTLREALGGQSALGKLTAAEQKDLMECALQTWGKTQTAFKRPANSRNRWGTTTTSVGLFRRRWRIAARAAQ